MKTGLLRLRWWPSCRAAALIFALTGLAGCATSLATGHSAQVLEQGHLEVQVNTGGLVPVSAYERLYVPAVQQARSITDTLSKGGQVNINAATMSDVMVGAGYLLAGLPDPQTEVSLRYGLVSRFDIGVRYSGSIIRGEIWGQPVKGRWPVAIGMGVGHRSIDHGALGTLSDLGLLNFRETDVDLTVLTGRTWKHGTLYLGPKVMYSSYTTDGSLTNGQSVTVTLNNGTLSGTVDFDLSHSVAYGAVIGGRVGWDHWYVSLELGVYGALYKPSVFGQTVDLSGLTVYPVAGIGADY